MASHILLAWGAGLCGLHDGLAALLGDASVVGTDFDGHGEIPAESGRDLLAEAQLLMSW